MTEIYRLLYFKAINDYLINLTWGCFTFYFILLLIYNVVIQRRNVRLFKIYSIQGDKSR